MQNIPETPPKSESVPKPCHDSWHVRAVGLVVMLITAAAPVSPATEEKPPPAAPAEPVPTCSNISFGIRVIDLQAGHKLTALLSAAMGEGPNKDFGVLPVQRAHDLDRSLTDGLNRLPGVGMMVLGMQIAPANTGSLEFAPRKGENIKCTMTGRFVKATGGALAVELTASASIRQLRPGAVDPQNEKSYETLELAPTKVTIPLEGSALFRLPTEEGAATRWLMISASELAAEPSGAPGKNPNGTK